MDVVQLALLSNIGNVLHQIPPVLLYVEINMFLQLKVKLVMMETCFLMMDAIQIAL